MQGVGGYVCLTSYWGRLTTTLAKLGHTVLTDGMQIHLPPCPHIFLAKVGTSSHHFVATEWKL